MGSPSSGPGLALITGLEGFTGSYIQAALEARGWRVAGLDSRSSNAASILCDLMDPAAVRAVVEELSPDAVIHLAGIANVAHERKDDIYLINIVGTRNLLEALAALPRRPSSVVLASSANVYGNTAGVLDEAVAPAPTNDYAISKLAMEYLARTYLEKLPITITRPFNYTGKGQSTNFVVPKIVEHFKSRAPRIELGNIDVTREFTDVRRVAEAYARLVSLPGSGEVYNISSGRGATLREVVATASRLTGHELELTVNPAFVRENEVQTLVGSDAKLEKAVGALPPFSLEDTIRWMLEE